MIPSYTSPNIFLSKYLGRYKDILNNERTSIEKESIKKIMYSYN